MCDITVRKVLLAIGLLVSSVTGVSHRPAPHVLPEIQIILDRPVAPLVDDVGLLSKGDAVLSSDLLKTYQGHEDTQLLQLHAGKVPNVSSPLNCLRLTNPSIELEYPADAEAHFEEIRSAMAPWGANVTKTHCAAGYCGPWLENVFIEHFGQMWDQRAAGTRLSDVFGPYIPLLVPWVDNWLGEGHAKFQYPKGMINALMKVYRPNVPYIAFSQNDEGLTGKKEFLMSRIPNVLVLSAGGYGHVPVPLIKGVMDLATGTNAKMAGRDMMISYLGSMGHAPENLRERMATLVKEQVQELGITTETFFGRAEDWKEKMRRSHVSLCPRGYGRTAYHLVEILQMGLIPAYVYNDGDVPWVPYADLFPKLGFVRELQGVKDLVAEIHHMSDAELQRMEAAVREVRESHFLPEGVMNQVSLFMTRASGDLRCQKLPDRIRGAPWEAVLPAQ